MDICVIIDIEGSIDFQITNQAWSLMKKTAASLKTMTRHDLFGSRSALLTAMKLSFFLTDLGICRRFYFMLWCLFVKVLSNETYEATLCIVLRIRLHGIQGTEGSREIYQQRQKRKQRRRLYSLQLESIRKTNFEVDRTWFAAYGGYNHSKHLDVKAGFSSLHQLKLVQVSTC